MRESVDQFVRFLGLERNASPETVRAYRGRLRQVAAWLEGRLGPAAGPADLTGKLLREYLAWMAGGGRGRSAVVGHIDAIRAWCAWLQYLGQVADNPAQVLRSPRLVRPLPRFMEVSEVEATLAAIRPDTFKGARDLAALEVLYSTACRVSELLGMDLGDLRLAEGTVLIRGKGRKERMGLLGPPAVSAVSAYLDQRSALVAFRRERSRQAETQALFLTEDGRRPGRKWAERTVKERAAAAGLDPRQVHAHAWRHSASKAMMDRGCPIAVLQDYLGHSSPEVTRRYGRISQRTVFELFRSHPLA